ncbi:MAG: hypothetical protein LBD23_09525 [Oscillospiraceae bacterium]|nr:hypothetical protein [Oscillospiraceae bacterium]
MSRCGIDPAEYFSRDDFEHLYNFNTVETMAILGSSVSELSERVLRDIERTTRIYERTKQRKAGQGEPDKPLGLNRNNKKIDNEL